MFGQKEIGLLNESANPPQNNAYIEEHAEL